MLYEVDRPVTEGKVRLRSPLAGIVYTPLKDDPTKTRMEIVLEADLAGIIPAFLRK